VVPEEFRLDHGAQTMTPSTLLRAVLFFSQVCVRTHFYAPPHAATPACCAPRCTLAYLFSPDSVFQNSYLNAPYYSGELSTHLMFLRSGDFCHLETALRSILGISDGPLSETLLSYGGIFPFWLLLVIPQWKNISFPPYSNCTFFGVLTPRSTLIRSLFFPVIATRTTSFSFGQICPLPSSDVENAVRSSIFFPLGTTVALWLPCCADESGGRATGLSFLVPPPHDFFVTGE